MGSEPQLQGISQYDGEQMCLAQEHNMEPKDFSIQSLVIYRQATVLPTFLESIISSPLPTMVAVKQIIEPVHEKTNNLGSDQIRHKPGCTVTEEGY